jgi:hypothetical protein
LVWYYRWRRLYHEDGPDGVVEKDDGSGHKHGEADEFIELEKKLVFLPLCLVL